MSKFSAWVKQAIHGVGKQLLLTLGGYILLVVFAIVLTNLWMNMLTSTRVEIIHTRDVIGHLQNLRTSLARAESAQSTYLLTQRPEYIQPFEEQIIQVRENAASVQTTYRSAAQDNFDRKISALWQAIQKDVEGKITVMRLAVSMLSNGRDDRAVEIINAGDGDKRMADFVLHTDLLMAIEAKKLQELSARSGVFLSVGRVIVTASVLLVLVLMVMVAKKFITQMIKSKDSEELLQNEVQSFEEKLAERTRLLETLARDYQYDVERERHKLSRELHDELGSILTATKMDISWVIRKIRETVPEAAEKLAKTMRYLDQGIEFKRRVVNDLHPSLLSTFGLIPALQELMDSYAERNGWRMTINLPEHTIAVSEVLGLIAYRIVQESLNNASKYAEATEVTINFLVDATHLKLEISDNGKGMDTNQGHIATHGLDGMRHRVIAVGGTFKIESQPGKGMFTLALIPLVSETQKQAASKKLMAASQQV